MGLGSALGLTKRRSDVTKLQAAAALAVSRSAVLKKLRQARVSVARSDVVNLLKMGFHDRALIRVEQVIRLQNGLDALAALDSYLNLLTESVNLIEQEKSCPDELNEAVSTLIFASARMGDFPELLQIRSIFTSRYGKGFASRAVDLRNNCGVSPRIVQMLSAAAPSLENRKRMLKKIADEENIDLPSENTPSSHPELGEQGESPKMGGKYKDVADAAQQAFESAAYAAAAARAAVELSRGGHSGGPRRPEEWTARIKEDEKPTRNDQDKNTGNSTVDGSSNSSEISEAPSTIPRTPTSVRTRRFHGR